MNPSESMIQALRNAGYRITPQRKAIVCLLAESDEHPSAQMIFDTLIPQFEILSLATVYNTLETLTQLGLVNVLGEIGNRDAVRYDADTMPHVNLACVQCHRIIDIPNATVDHLAEEVAAQSGYTLYGARVLYYGLCPSCKQQKAETLRNQV